MLLRYPSRSRCSGHRCVVYPAAMTRTTTQAAADDRFDGRTNGCCHGTRGRGYVPFPRDDPPPWLAELLERSRVGWPVRHCRVRLEPPVRGCSPWRVSNVLARSRSGRQAEDVGVVGCRLCAADCGARCRVHRTRRVARGLRPCSGLRRRCAGAAALGKGPVRMARIRMGRGSLGKLGTRLSTQPGAK